MTQRDPATSNSNFEEALEKTEGQPGQPMTAAEDAAPPKVPTHETPSLLSESAEAKIWRHGTLVFTTAGLFALFFWLLFGDFAVSLRERSVGPVVTLMLKGWKANNLTISLLMSVIPTAISMVLGPVVSYKSDRLRSRWGRRIPFLLIPTPIAALSMIGLAFTPHIATGLQHVTHDALSRHAALLVTFLAFWTCFDIAVVISGSVFGGLINDVVPRPVIGRFYAMFRAVSLIDGMIFNWYILGHAEQHFTVIFIAISLVFGIGFSLMCLMVKEGDYPTPVMNPNDHRAGGFFAAAGVYFRECFSHPHYLMIFAMGLLAAMAASPVNAWSLLYAKSLSLDLDKWSANGIGFGSYRLGYGGIITLTYICSLTLAYPLGMLVDRFHTIRVSIGAMILYALALWISAACIHGPTSFGWALLAHGVLSGTYFTAAAALGQALMPRSKFSQFSSAGSLMNQVFNLGWGPLLGWILDRTGSNYRITFFFSAAFATGAVCMLMLVYRRFQKMGGAAGYVAPGDDVAGGPPTGGFPVVLKSH